MSEPADYTWPKADAQILKAEWSRDAQSRRCLQHIVEMLGGIDAVGFDPDNSNVTAFNAGRRWVARQIQRAVIMPLDQIAPEHIVDEPRTSVQRRILHAGTNRRIERAKSGPAD